MKDSEAKPLIMIVDDNPKNLQVLGSLLSKNGYSAIAAQSGQQALEYLEKKLPEVILLDVMMPEMDGIEVCNRIKADETTREIPILFITALNDIGDKVKAFTAGGADYITKPFVAEEVLARVKVHLENSRLLNNMKEANAHLRDLNDLKNRFIGIAAHDVRSPLSGANGIVDLMLEGELGEITDQQREFLELVASTGKQILNLVGDLLDVSVIESGNLKLDFKETTIRNIIEDRIRLHQIAVNKKKITITPQLIDVPPFRFDPERFGQVLDNLVSNAAKFSPENSEIRIVMESDDNHLKVSVVDSGPGISAEDQDQLFAIYRKLTARPTAGEKSSGLGLAIAKKIMDAHQGDVLVSSTLGEGATFTVVFPLTGSD